jgi:imidazolonepropionase-like amidohydrolase
VTLYPARILGLDDRLGSIEAGKDATLIVTDGHPLEYSTQVEQAYIQGRAIDLTDKHKRLRDLYLERYRQTADR